MKCSTANTPSPLALQTRGAPTHLHRHPLTTTHTRSDTLNKRSPNTQSFRCCRRLLHLYTPTYVIPLAMSDDGRACQAACDSACATSWSTRKCLSGTSTQMCNRTRDGRQAFRCAQTMEAVVYTHHRKRRPNSDGLACAPVHANDVRQCEILKCVSRVK